MSEFMYENRSDILKCPYCGYINDWGDNVDNKSFGVMYIIDCENCEKKFGFEMIYEVKIYKKLTK